MSVLSGPEIVRLVHRTRLMKDGTVLDSLPRILIEPFDEKFAGPNSYDVHLAPELRVYAIQSVATIHPELFANLRPRQIYKLPVGVDAHTDTPTVPVIIPEEGLWLHPGVLYLGATVERTLCEGLVPWLDGRSSVGRLGLSVHVTAGRGDDGWPGRWTMEMQAETHPVKVYPNMRVGQVTYFTLEGERKPYEGRYRDQDGATASRLHLDAPKKEDKS